MQPQPFSIGVITSATDGYYFGAMLSGIHQITRQAGVPLLVIQSGLQDLRLPAFGADHVAGWIILHPMENDTAKLTTLVAVPGELLTALAHAVTSSTPPRFCAQLTHPGPRYRPGQVPGNTGTGLSISPDLARTPRHAC